MGYSNALEYLDSKLQDERALIVETLIQGKLGEGEYKRLYINRKGRIYIVALK